jgi:hypothetical protein
MPSSHRPLGSLSRVLLIFLALVILPRDAYAYVDPGTGSLAWQLIVSAAIGGTFYARRTIGLVWRTFARRLRGGPQSGARSPSDTDIGD